MKLGVIADCFRLPLKESIALAGTLGFEGVQIYATGGEFCPSTLSAGARSEYRRLLSDNGLAVSALCGDMGGYGFEIEQDNAERIEKTCRIVDLAAELGAKAVTTHIGVIPSNPTHPRYDIMVRALGKAGRYAATQGVTLAIETGPESARTLLGFLERADAGKGLGVNLDPANFVMVTGEDPIAAVRLLAPYLVHTHAKDGRMLRRADPEEIYGAFARGGIDALNVADYFIETPIGEGSVDFPAYLAALKEVGYDGFLTIERETGADPVQDIRIAVSYLKERLKELE